MLGESKPKGPKAPNLKDLKDTSGKIKGRQAIVRAFQGEASHMVLK